VRYKVVDWDPEGVMDHETVAGEIERLLNDNAANGWELDRFEDLVNGNRRFYFKMSYDDVQAPND